MNTEHWTPVKGYETLYEITETGQVRSWAFGGWRRRTAPKLLKWRINTFGYATVALSNGPGNKPWNVLVHRLVALNFIPNPANAPQINHKDSNKLNNHISNLEWVTQRETCVIRGELALTFPNVGNLLGTQNLNRPTSIRFKRLLKPDAQGLV